MTCIVGLKYENSVFIGGDSAGIDSDFSCTIRADTKVFKSGPFIMGFAGSFRIGQLLRFSLNPPEQLPSQTDYEYMVTSFINAVRDCLAEGGIKRVVEGVEEGGTFLVGYKENLYIIEEDFQVGVEAVGYCSIGCARDIALGAMHVQMESDNKVPFQMIEKALNAACDFSAGVCKPFIIIEG